MLSDLDGVVAAYRAATPYYAASTIKLAILIAALREVGAGRVDPDEQIVVGDSFPRRAGGGFRLHQQDDQDDATWARLGGTERWATLLERMIVESSNIATDLILDSLTLDPVSRLIARAGAGGMIVRHYIGDATAASGSDQNRVTAEALARIMMLLATGRLLPPPATASALDLLARQRHRRMIPAGLPSRLRVAGKPGWTDAVTHDVALVHPDTAPPFVLAVCTNDSAERVARIAAVTWEHWSTWHTSRR